MFSCISINKNVIAYLLLVQSGPFNHRNLSSYAFASVGMQEEAGCTATAGDLVLCSIVDETNFYVEADAG